MSPVKNPSKAKTEAVKPSIKTSDVDTPSSSKKPCATKCSKPCSSKKASKCVEAPAEEKIGITADPKDFFCYRSTKVKSSDLEKDINGIENMLNKKQQDGAEILNRLCNLFERTAAEFPEIGLTKITTREYDEKVKEKDFIDRDGNPIESNGSYKNVFGQVDHIIFLKMLFLDEKAGTYKLGYVDQENIYWCPDMTWNETEVE